MALTVLSADPSNQRFRFRRCLTMLLCLPMMVVHMMLMLADQCLPTSYQVPHAIYAISEYIVVLLLAVWPLTWAAEVQDTWQRNTSGNFAWPVTPWRFA